MEAVVKTSRFTIDRKSYAKAKIGLLARRIGLPLALLLVINLIVLTGSDDSTLHILLLCADSVLALFLVCIFQITLTRIFGPKYRHLSDSRRTIEFSSSIISVKAEGLGDSTVSWNLFTGVETVGSWTFLLQDRSPIVAIPESSFASEDELKSFHKLIGQKRSEFKKKGH